MEIILASITRSNIGAVVRHSDVTSSEFYGLPTNEAEAQDYLRRIENNRRSGVGDDYLAYEATPRQVVGGGQLVVQRDVLTIGYWVPAAYRRQGYGKAIVHALEVRGALDFPSMETIEAHIDPKNAGSLALAVSMGYTFARQMQMTDVLIYQKALQAG